MIGKYLTRRNFLIGSAVTMAGAAGGWSWHRAHQKVVRTAVIGTGMRGQQLLKSLGKTSWLPIRSDVVSICDVDQRRLAAAKRLCPGGVTSETDFNRVLERDDIQAVVIATPDHWHVPLATRAIQAGKAVYCEKPMTLTIHEGQQLVRLVRATDTPFQVGSQQRSFSRFRTACELVHEGRLGDVHTATVHVPVNLSGKGFQVSPIPAELDWNSWLGPAADSSFQRERFETFRGFYEYSGGSLADWGAHHVDIAQRALGLELAGPIEISGEGELPPDRGDNYNVPPSFSVTMKYATGQSIKVVSDAQTNGIMFEGSRGRIWVNRKRITGKPFEDLASTPLPTSSRFEIPQESQLGYEVSHLWNFLHAVIHRTPTVSDVASQHRTASTCHLANLSLRLGRTLTWDPEAERFTKDAEAQSYVHRTSRLELAENVTTR